MMNECYEAAARSRKGGRHYLGMSEIGEKCERALWYSFRGFPEDPLEGRIIMLFRFGDRVEEELIHHLRLAGYEVEGQQDGFSDYAGLFLGHCDGIIHGVTSSKHILECKSCNKRMFGAFKTAGVLKTQPKYYDQCQAYMGYSGLDRALVTIQCKDDSAIYFERIYFSPTAFQAIVEKAYRIITANEPINQPFKMTSRQCEWCRYRTYCWYQEETIVDKHVCGTCRYISFKGLKKVCRHPSHPIQILQWGIGCPDWVEMTSKEAGPDPVSVDQITIQVA